MSGFMTKIGQVYIVADGMGGHRSGALAAELTVKGLQQYLSKVPPQLSVREAIQAAFEQTNQTVYEKAHCGDPATESMGSTAVLLLVTGSVTQVSHVGDSRAYLYRAGQLQQLTTDHSRVQRMVDAGMLTPAEARDHPESYLLERAIGQKPSIEVDIAPELPLEEGDGILLCTDGLCGYVDDQEIERVLRSGATVQEVTDRLVKLALAKGGHDNVTVQFIQYGRRREARSKKARLVRRITTPLLAVALIGLLYYFYGLELRIYLCSTYFPGAVLCAGKEPAGLSQRELSKEGDPPKQGPSPVTPEPPGQSSTGDQPHDSQPAADATRANPTGNQGHQRR